MLIELEAAIFGLNVVVAVAVAVEVEEGIKEGSLGELSKSGFEYEDRPLTSF